MIASKLHYRRRHRSLRIAGLPEHLPRSFAAAPRGILTIPPEPYRGPKEFAITADKALLDVTHAGHLRASARVFWIRRDESIILPYGGFRIYLEGREIGRSLSWPDYDTCMRVRRGGRAAGHHASDDSKRSYTGEQHAEEAEEPKA